MTELVTKVAFRKDYVIFTTAAIVDRHGDLFRRLYDLGIRIPDAEQGFLTSLGRWVDRTEAMAVATKAGQITDPPDRTELYSEDIW